MKECLSLPTKGLVGKVKELRMEWAKSILLGALATLACRERPRELD